MPEPRPSAGHTGRTVVERAFARRFGGEPAVVARAPGRVNLIGEHTDYNDGFVLPMAIDRALWVALRPLSGGRVRLFAVDLDEPVESDLDAPPPTARQAQWSDYVRGVAWSLRSHGHPVGGFEAALHGDVPRGAGMSSSAALCVGVALALAGAFKLPIDARRLALSARAAEVEFVGLDCGIMDQFASALSVPGHALLVDCRTTETRPVALPLDDLGVSVVVIDSATPRGLAASAYNRRVAECRSAVAAAARRWPDRRITALRDLDAADLPTLAEVAAPVVLRRARHVVTENGRVLAALDALTTNDMGRLGGLMLESHQSLRDDYAVSTPELDLLVDLAMRTPGVIGARLTGAGFGGCTVNLVQRGAVAGMEAVLARYRRHTGREARLYQFRPSGGARLLTAG